MLRQIKDFNKDIYNFNKTECLVNIVNSLLVIVLKGYIVTYVNNPKNRELITFIKYTFCDGED